MPRTYALIKTGMWSRPYFQEMTARGQLAYFYVRCSAQTSRCGVTPLIYDTWARNMGKGGETIREGVQELISSDAAWVDYETAELFVPDCIRDEMLDRQQRVLERAIQDAQVVRSAQLQALVLDELEALAVPRATLAVECLRAGRSVPPNPKLQNKYRTVDRPAVKRMRGQFTRSSARLRLRAEIEAGMHVCPCGSVENLQVDHIVSIARGGDNSLGNLQVLCAGCNNRKGAGV